MSRAAVDAPHHWYAVSWVDWVTVIGFIVTLLGLFLAWKQARSAADSAEQARAAAVSAESAIARNNLLVLLPQCQRVESDLEWAIGRADADLVIHYLGVWRWQAGQLRSLLSRSDPVDTELLAELQKSIAVSAETKISMQAPGVDVLKKSKQVQIAIAAVTGKIGELATQTSMNGGAN